MSFVPIEKFLTVVYNLNVCVKRSIVLLLRMLLLYAYLMPAFFLATAAKSISTYLFDLLVRSIGVLLSMGPVRCSHIRAMKEGDWYSLVHEIELYLHRKRHSQTSNSKECNRKAELQIWKITQSIDYPLLRVKTLPTCRLSIVKKSTVNLLYGSNWCYPTSSWHREPGMRYDKVAKPVRNVVSV